MHCQVNSAGAPLPPARHLVPSVAKKWNHFKGRTDESTAALDRMIFPFTKATPKMQLVLREMKKFALQVLAVKRHCFLGKKLPLDKGFRGIQMSLGHSKLSLKGVLHELALSYRLINPMHSMIPGSPTGRGIESEFSSDEDVEENVSARGLAEYQKQAKKYVTKKMATTYQPFKKFKVDKQLDQIRKDTRLNHIPKSIRDDSKSKKKIQVMKKRQTKKKYRLQSPRCAVCVWVYGSAKASRTIYRCSVCGIPLCTTIKGKAKKSCWDRFHTCSCLSSIETKKPAIPTRKSPRKEGRTGSVTVNGKRQSTRKK